MRRALAAAVLPLLLSLALLAACGSTTPAPRPTAPASAASSVAPGTSAAAPEPVVHGNELVDARTGDRWVPHGVDWSSLEYACAQGWGYSALDTLDTDPETSAATMAAAIAAWHADVVRLPLNQDCWLGTRGAPVSDASTTRTAAGYRAEVAAFVTALHRDGIAVILDLQSRKRVGAAAFGNVAMPDAGSLRFWRSVAAAYKDDPSIMYDAFNEPYSRAVDGRPVFTLTWPCWRDGGCRPPVEDDRSPLSGRTHAAVGMSQVVSAIRAVGAHQPILLGGLDYANDLGGWLAHRPDDDQLVAAFHSYDFKTCLAPCWDGVVAPLAAVVPVLTSEVGADEPTGGYVRQYLTWADAHGIGVLFWAWGNAPSDPMALTDGLTGAPTAYGRIALTWLTSGTSSGP